MHIGCSPSPAKSFRSTCGVFQWVLVNCSAQAGLLFVWVFFLKRWCCGVPIRPHAGSISPVFLWVGTHRPGSRRIYSGSRFVTCSRRGTSACAERAWHHVALPRCRVQGSAWVRLARTSRVGVGVSAAAFHVERVIYAANRDAKISKHQPGAERWRAACGVAAWLWGRPTAALPALRSNPAEEELGEDG